MIEDLDHWKRLAMYLADCCAATAEGLPKKAAKWERRRQSSICHNAALALRGEWIDSTPRPLQDIADRCYLISEELREKK